MPRRGWRTARIVTGCNVENASYGLTLCAECTMVGAARMNGGGLITEFYCVDGNGGILMPCGRCRQLLYEFSTAETRIMTSSGVKTMDEVLPDAFGPRDLDRLAASLRTTAASTSASTDDWTDTP